MDAVGSTVQFLYEIVNWGQMAALPLAAIAFLVGGILQMDRWCRRRKKSKTLVYWCCGWFSSMFRMYCNGSNFTK